jgi:autotransporter-associated beta strand protein
MLTEVVVQGAITGGRLTKTGAGTLFLENNSADMSAPLINSFNGLTILQGNVIAQGEAGSVINIGSGPSPVGGGNIVLNGSTARLEITAWYDSYNPNNTLGAVNFTSAASISLDGGAQFFITRADAVNFTGGTVTFNHYADTLVLDAKTTFGGTTFEYADNITFTLKRDVEFFASSSVLSHAAKLDFAPAAGATQNITLASAGDFAHSGTILVSGPGTTSLSAGIAALSAAGGLNIGSGTLALNKENQINTNTVVTFDNASYSPAGTILLNGHSQKFGSVTVAANSTDIFDFGAQTANTTLEITSFAGDILRIRNYNTGDTVKRISSWNGGGAGNVWFYGYQKGAQTDGAGNYIPPAQRLSGAFDNTTDGSTVASDWNWYNPVNWVGDDVFNIPNAPGVTASIKIDSGVLSTIKGRTISLGENETTIGNLDTHVGSSANTNGSALIISGGNGAKLIFDSGADGVVATWTAKKVFNFTDTVEITVPVVLKSDLEVTNSASQGSIVYAETFNSISGAGKIIKKDTSLGSLGNLYFRTANPYWSGGLELLQGRIYVGAEGALGTGVLTINSNNASTLPGITRGSGGANIKIGNQVDIKGGFMATHVTFTHPTLTLNDVYRMDINTNSLNSALGRGQWRSPYVVIESQVMDGAGKSGGFKITSGTSGSDFTSYFSDSDGLFLRLDNPNNTFSGGLEAGTGGAAVAIVGTNQSPATGYGMVIGAAESNKNYFGVGALTFSKINPFTGDSTGASGYGYGRFVIVTQDNGRNAEVRGDGANDTIIGKGDNGYVRFIGQGGASVTAQAKINLSAGDVIFAAKTNTISGGNFTLSGTGRVIFDNQKYNAYNNNTWGAEVTDVSTNIISAGDFILTGGSGIYFQAAGENANTISGGAFNLGGSDGATGVIRVGKATGDTVLGARIVHFKGGNITGTGAIVVGDDGVWSFEGGAVSGSNRLVFDTQSSAEIRAGSGYGELSFASVSKSGLGTATIDSSVVKLRADAYSVHGGILRPTLAAQLLGANGGNTASLSIGGGGVLDISALGSTDFGALAVNSGGGSFSLGATGKLFFTDLAAWDTSDTDFFFIQGAAGGWNSASSGNYVAFAHEPSGDILGAAQLKNITFSGYESGARILQAQDGSNNYFLAPAAEAMKTVEWTGKAVNDFKGVKWSRTDNWFSVDGNVSAVPGSAGGSTSVTFRDMDARLGDDVGKTPVGAGEGKRILVDGTYTLAHLNIETSATKFFLNQSNGGNLVFKNDGAIAAQIKHTGNSIFTIAAPVRLEDDTRLVLNAKRENGHVVLSGQITGGGGIIKTGGGDLRITGVNNTFGGGFTWIDNEGHLQIRNTASGATPLGTGLVTFGENGLSVTHIEAGLPNGTAYGHINISGGGLLLHGGINLDGLSELGVPETGKTSRLEISAPAGGPGILLAPGEHVVTTDVNSFALRLSAPVHDQNSHSSGSLKIIGADSGVPNPSFFLYLAGNNDFSGGVTLAGSGLKSLYLGHDNALGTGPLTLGGANGASGTFNLYATDAAGNTLVNADTSRLITNQLIFASSGARIISYGNLIFDRNPQDEPWTIKTKWNIGQNSYSTINIELETGAFITEDSSLGKMGLAFGKNLVFEGEGKIVFQSESDTTSLIRLFGAGSTYSGGTEFKNAYLHNSTFYVLLGAETKMEESGAAIKNGPLGTGAIRITTAGVNFIPWSTDPDEKTRTIVNEITLHQTDTEKIGVLKTKEIENYADTIVLDSTKIGKPLALTRNLSLAAGAGATLQINSQITGNFAISKIDVGAVVLANPANSFARSEVTAGALIARDTTENVLVAPANTPGRADYFGLGAPTVVSADPFEVQADNYANGRAALVVESSGAVTVSPGADDSQPFYLIGNGAAFIVGGSADVAAGEGMGFKGAGVLKLGGVDTTLHGRVDGNTAAAGWLVADRIVKDTAGTLGIGLNLRANHLEINGGTLKMTAPELLSGVADLHFSGVGATLALNGFSQSLRPGGTLGADEIGRIQFTTHGNLLPSDEPVSFTFGRIADDNTGAFYFENWQGNQSNGLGLSRVVTTDYRRGELVPNVYLIEPGQSPSGSGIALVMRNTEGKNVLVPLNSMLTWTGTAMNAQPGNAHWEQVYTPQQGTNLTNWEDSDNPGSSRWPGSGGRVQDASRVISFDTRLDTTNTTWKWDNLVIPITTDGFSGDSNTPVAIGGSILIYGSNRSAQITFASGADAGASRLTLDNGAAENAGILLAVNARLRVNLPVYLVSDNGAMRHNDLSVNTAHAGSIVELNETITGLLGSALYKNGAGHLFLRGDNSIPGAGLSIGVVLEGGHLYIGNPKSIGTTDTNAYLRFSGGTLHPVKDWYANPDIPPVPAGVEYTDMVVPNHYYFSGGVTLAGDKEFAFRNTLGDNGASNVIGKISADSIVNIPDQNAKLTLDGENFSSADGATVHTLTFTGAGAAEIYKSGAVAKVNITAAGTETSSVKIAVKGNIGEPGVAAGGNVANTGAGALKLGDYDAAGGGVTAGSVGNSGTGTLEIATTGRTYNNGAGATAQNTGKGITRVTGADNIFTGGITSSGGGQFIIEAAAKASGTVAVSGNSTLRLKAPLAHGGTGSINATVAGGGRIILDATNAAAGHLNTNDSTKTGSVIIYDGGILEFVVAANGNHGIITTGNVDARFGGELKISFNQGVGATEFISGYTLNLFDPSRGGDFVLGEFTDGAGWKQGNNVSITRNGGAITLDTGLAWRFDRLSTAGEIYIGEAISKGYYWDGVAGQVWNKESNNTIWRLHTYYESTREEAEAAGGRVAFKEAERMIFDKHLAKDGEEAILLAVKIEGNMTVHSILVTGAGSDFVFTGGKINVEDIDGELNTPEENPYYGIASGIVVGNGASARFENAVSSSFLKIENNARATLVYNEGESDTAGIDEKFDFIHEGDGARGVEISSPNGTLFIEQNSGDLFIFSSVISGLGNFVKTGKGTLSLDGENTYNGVVSGADGKIVGGGTHVAEGKLVVNQGLGNGTPSGGQTFARDYIGAIKVDKDATLRFTMNSGDGGQRLGGHIGQDYDTNTANGYAYMPEKPDGTIEVNGGYYEIAAARNSFQGNLSIGEGGEYADPTRLNISGGIGTVRETFDGGTRFEASYYHNRYTGNINILGANDVVEFSYKGDYQYMGGALTGPAGSELRINSGMPFYFNGNAGNFAGTTTVDGNSIFHLNVPAGSQYGGGVNNTDARGRNFEVKSGSALYVGGGGKIYTENFAMEQNTTLVVNPGKFTIDSASTPTFGEENGKNITLVFRVSQGDFTVGDINGGSIADAKLTVDPNGNGGVVLHPNTALRVDAFGYIPQPSQGGYFALMDGLDVGAMLAGNEDNAGTREALVKNIFGTKDLYVMNAWFEVFFIEGKLVASLKECRGVPEPSAYGLFSGVLVASLSFLRRRRKNKRAGA